MTPNAQKLVVFFVFLVNALVVVKLLCPKPWSRQGWATEANPPQQPSSTLKGNHKYLEIANCIINAQDTSLSRPYERRRPVSARFAIDARHRLIVKRTAQFHDVGSLDTTA